MSNQTHDDRSEACGRVRVAILCISDDTPLDIAPLDVTMGGRGLVEGLSGPGHVVVATMAVADRDDAIQSQVQAWIESSTIDLIFTIDRRSSSGGGSLPNINLFLNDVPVPACSGSYFDRDIGWIGWVDILAAQEGTVPGFLVARDKS